MISSHYARLSQILDAYWSLGVGSRQAATVSALLPYNDALKDPAAQGAGCYAIFASGDRLRHIGMSRRKVVTRIRGHFLGAKNSFWLCGLPENVALIGLLEPDEALLLEAYLTYHTRDLREETWDYAKQRPR